MWLENRTGLCLTARGFEGGGLCSFIHALLSVVPDTVGLFPLVSPPAVFPLASLIGICKVARNKTKLIRMLEIVSCRGWALRVCSPWRALGCLEVLGCYLVDPASSHMLVSKIKPCMSKYELIQTVKLRMAH
jgi:hypothetical protein